MNSMNWGKGLALALIAFAAMMAWFVVKAVRNTEPLVTEEYYKAELKFQQRIDRSTRAAALSAPVQMDLRRGSVDLRFPRELDGGMIIGTLTLLRPNDPAGDVSIAIATDSARYLSTAITLMAGRYNASLEWERDGVTYFTEHKAYVP